MLIIPAIDIRGGKCVRLRQGDYDQETVFGDDPVEMARRWADQGARLIHLVDLDGAKAGRPENLAVIKRITAAVRVPCQLGGGIRSSAHVTDAMYAGISRLVIGTQALKSPQWFGEVSQEYPQKLILGIDAKKGRVATEGWLDVSSCSAIDLAKQYQALPLAGLIYTDISRDGMMQGPNLSAMREMAEAISLPLIASGGVSKLEDIRDLSALPIEGCIVGRALYEGAFSLKDATEACAEQEW